MPDRTRAALHPELLVHLRAGHDRLVAIQRVQPSPRLTEAISILGRFIGHARPEATEGHTESMLDQA